MSNGSGSCESIDTVGCVNGADPNGSVAGSLDEPNGSFEVDDCVRRGRLREVEEVELRALSALTISGLLPTCSGAIVFIAGFVGSAFLKN